MMLDAAGPNEFMAESPARDSEVGKVQKDGEQKPSKQQPAEGVDSKQAQRQTATLGKVGQAQTTPRQS